MISIYEGEWPCTPHLYLIFFFHLAGEPELHVNNLHDRIETSGDNNCHQEWSNERGGETLYAFRNGSANYSPVLVSRSLSLSLFFPRCFPFISISKASLFLSLSLPVAILPPVFVFPSLSLSLSLSGRQSWPRSFNTLFERPRAGNWKFRASDPVRMFATAGLIRETCVQIARKKKPETPVDRMNEHRSKQFYRSNLYPGTSTGKTIFKSH